MHGFCAFQRPPGAKNLSNFSRHVVRRPYPPTAPRRNGQMAKPSRRQPRFRAKLRCSSHGSLGFGADFEGRKPAPSHRTLCIFPRPPQIVSYFTMRSAQTATARRRQARFRPIGAAVRDVSAVLRAARSSRRPPEVAKLARTSEGNWTWASKVGLALWRQQRSFSGVAGSTCFTASQGQEEANRGPLASQAIGVPRKTAGILLGRPKSSVKMQGKAWRPT